MSDSGGGPRRRSRELALTALFAADGEPPVSAETALLVASDVAGAELEDATASIPGDDRPFTMTLIRGVFEHRTQIDEALARASRNWRIERMARVDRNVMRLALFEILHCDDIPARVTLNEAIELARRFGAEDAPAFVNGILDRALVDLDVQK